MSSEEDRAADEDHSNPAPLQVENRQHNEEEVDNDNENIAEDVNVVEEVVEGSDEGSDNEEVEGDEEEDGEFEIEDAFDMEGILIRFEDFSDDDYGDNDDDEDNSDSDGDEQTFDTTLPTSHSYLGNDLETLHGRTVHAEGDNVILPLFHIPGIVIVPGQILPLNLFHPQTVSMMKRVISADKTFGLLLSKTDVRGEDEFASVGVTCEIFSVKEEESHGISHILLKAEGRQRFKLISKEHQLDGVILGKIIILPDAYISPQPRDSLIHTLMYPQRNAIRSQVLANRFYLNDKNLPCDQQRYLVGFNQKHAQLLCTSVTGIQGWTYKLYNPYFLMDCLLHEIRSWNQNLKFDTIPHNPIDFSYWITKNLPLTNEMKIELLQIDSAPLRLRKQIEFMNKFGSGLACKHCESLITDKNELFSLSKRGPMGAYVNPYGHVHETVTFHKATNLSLQGRPSTEYSWFPGYAWTITNCKTCRRHMGWKFTATKKELKPKKFWGLTRAALKPVYKKYDTDSMSEDDEKLSKTPTRPEGGDDEGGGADRYFINDIQYESSI